MLFHFVWGREGRDHPTSIPLRNKRIDIPKSCFVDTQTCLLPIVHPIVSYLATLQDLETEWPACLSLVIM
jgi:hypothetical protein